MSPKQPPASSDKPYDGETPESFARTHDLRFSEHDLCFFWYAKANNGKGGYMVGRIYAINTDQDSPHYKSAFVSCGDDTAVIPQDRVLGMRAEDLVNGGEHLVGQVFATQQEAQQACLDSLNDVGRMHLKEQPK